MKNESALRERLELALSTRSSFEKVSAHATLTGPLCGEMSEWLKEHAWKACVGVNSTVGSNPTLSAIIYL